jgi:hypothetical protein
VIRRASLLAVLAAAACVHVAAADATRVAFDHAVRELDGEQFLEDEPIWLCTGDPAGAPYFEIFRHDYRVIGVDRAGNGIDRRFTTHLPGEFTGNAPAARAAEFGSSFDFTEEYGRFPLFGDVGAIPSGTWQVRGAHGDTARVLARFRVVPPAGSERSVRDALARAARLTRQGGGPHARPRSTTRSTDAIRVRPT